ncbi:MAG: OsmC family protein [Myxococcales bacterium]|nr:OsmC family protein [Myxococcales bacterium]
MSTHHATTRWQRTTNDFTYESYSREHGWAFGSGSEVRASAAPEFRGDATLPNPEEALVAALSSCHLLTFLAICAKKGITVDEYEDAAEGLLEKNAEGRLAVTRVTLRPQVTFGAGAPADAEALAKLHESAHRGCFIAASVKTEIRVEPR